MPARGLDARVLLPPFLSASLLVLAQPPFHVLPLAFLSLTPLAVGVASLPPGSSSELRAAMQGMVFGLAFWGYSLVWIPLQVGRHFPWAFPGYGLLLTLLGGLSALFAWTTHGLHRRVGLPLALALPLAWVGVEWIRAHFPFGLAFPWLGLGVTLTRRPELLGMAEWTGEGGVAFWLASVSGWAAAGVMRMRGRGDSSEVRRNRGGWRPPGFFRSNAPGFLVGAALLAPACLGWARAATLPLHAGPEVVLVGTLVPRGPRPDPVGSARAALEQISAALGPLHGSPSGDFILLPEAVVPFPLEGDDAAPWRNELALWAMRSGVPVAVGALGKVPDGTAGHALTNSVYLILPDGRISQRYDKIRLVPGMEAGRYRPGAGGTLLNGDGWMYAPLLCYESLFGALARRARREGAHALLNLTSDIWFGDPETKLGALFLRQHPAHLVLRAVENRLPVARAANGGYSFVLDPVGRIASEVASPKGGLVRAQLLMTSGTTFFTRAGDIVGPASALLSLLLLLRARHEGIPRVSASSA